MSLQEIRLKGTIYLPSFQNISLKVINNYNSFFENWFVFKKTFIFAVGLKTYIKTTGSWLV